MSAHRRGPWSKAEDTYLLELVDSQGAHNWVRISHMIGSRSPKQCRERYHQNLKPSLSHDPITQEEGEIIEQLVGEMGKRWAEIARRLRGRSDNAVKNWWNGGMNRRRRIIVRHNGAGRPQEDYDALSFSPPAVNSPPPHSQTILVSRNPSGMIAPAMISPSLSEGSMPDSIGEAPSLISDSSSITSTSPFVARHPHPTLPPLRNPHVSDYQPNFPHDLNTSSRASGDSRSLSSMHSEQRRSSLPTDQRLHHFAEVAVNQPSSAGPPPALMRPLSQPQYKLPSFEALIRNVEHPEPSQPPSPEKHVMRVSDLLS